MRRRRSGGHGSRWPLLVGTAAKLLFQLTDASFSLAAGGPFFLPVGFGLASCGAFFQVGGQVALSCWVPEAQQTIFPA